MHDTRRDSPSFHRNIGPITAKLKELYLEPDPQVLEIGSGTGQHAVTFADEFPGFIFQPTDADPENIASIDAWVKHTGLSNVQKAILLDVTVPEAHSAVRGKYDLILCFNVIHITPWEVTEALFKLAGHKANPHARALLYGPLQN